MGSHEAIRSLQEYIKNLNTKTPIYHKVAKGMNTGNDERMQSALEQIELYKVGKGRLQQI